MDSDLLDRLDRAQELLRDLELEYNTSLALRNVTERAKNLTHIRRGRRTLLVELIATKGVLGRHSRAQRPGRSE